jgi:hypothetical protein
VNTLQAGILGGVLTLISGLAGGLGGSWLLGYLENRRERQRQRARHVTAVRIVVLELRRNGAALILQAAEGRDADLTSAAHDSHAAEFYDALLPRELAEKVASAYDLCTLGAPATPVMAKQVADRVLQAQLALESYGQTRYGMKFVDRKAPTDSTN